MFGKSPVFDAIQCLGDVVSRPGDAVSGLGELLAGTLVAMAVRRDRKARSARRRQRRLARVDNDLTDAQWETLQATWGGCAYCGAAGIALQRDCVLPVSRGGRYTISNVVPACRSCNTSKCNTEVSSWMRRKRLDEPAFLLRFAQTIRLLDPEA